jgi:hydrophobic/amphiphilic exporter-1 (mainly G- bacteria), HAE1 family
VVVPVVYCYLDDLAAWAKRKFGAKPSLALAMPSVTPAP